MTETFGTTLLGEGALNFVPDSVRRFLKHGHTLGIPPVDPEWGDITNSTRKEFLPGEKQAVVIPTAGCQYMTLVEIGAEIRDAIHLGEETNLQGITLGDLEEAEKEVEQMMVENGVEVDATKMAKKNPYRNLRTLLDTKYWKFLFGGVRNRKEEGYLGTNEYLPQIITAYEGNDDAIQKRILREKPLAVLEI